MKRKIIPIDQSACSGCGLCVKTCHEGAVAPVNGRFASAELSGCPGARLDPITAGMEETMKKIIVIGSPGAGKSTFARSLRDATGLPLYYLDMLWHKPDRTTVTRQAFDAALDAILCRGAWIIDGNYSRTLEKRLAACDTVFLLDYPLELCLSGVESRIGKNREDMPWVETDFDKEFKQWIVDFPHVQLPRIYALLEKYQENKTVFIFQSRKDADDYLKTL